jgi:hypothetical protein
MDKGTDKDNDGRIDKDEYKEAVRAEKSKLMKQVIFLTVLAALVSAAFYVGLVS